MARGIVRNFFYNTASQIISVLTPLITVPYLSRILGAEGIGLVSFSQSVVAYFVLIANLGINLYAQRQIAFNAGDKKKRSITFFNIKIFTFTTTVLSLLAYFVLLNVASIEPRIIYVIFAMNIVSVFLDVTWFFQGIEDFSKTFIANALVKVLDVAYIFAFVRTSQDVYVYAFGIGLFPLISHAALWLFLHKHIEIQSVRELNPFKDIKPIILLFLPVLAIQVYVVLDKTMLGMLTDGTLENGYYEQAQKLTRVILVLITSLGTVMMPRIARLFAGKQTEEIRKNVYLSISFVLMIGSPISFGLISISDSFVPWFFGAGFEPVAGLLKLSAILIVCIAISNVIGMQYLVPTMQQNKLTFSVGCGAFVNFFLNLCLIPTYAALGAMIASVFAEVTVTAVQLYVVRKEFSVGHILTITKNYFIAASLMLLALFAEDVFLGRSIYSTVVMIVSGGVVYTASLLLLKDSLFHEYLSRMRKFLP